MGTVAASTRTRWAWGFVFGVCVYVATGWSVFDWQWWVGMVGFLLMAQMTQEKGQ